MRVPDPGASRGGGGVVAAGHEVQGVLGVGQDADGAGAADVEGVAVAEVAEVGGDPTHGGVEQQRVGGVQGHPDVGGRWCAAGAQPHSAAGEGFVFVGGGAVGVVVEAGFVDQAGGVDLVDPLRGGRDQPVGEPDGVQGQVVGLAGDLPGPPHRDPAGSDVVPEPGEAVGQLQGVADQVPPRGQADPELGGQRGRRELGDLRGAGPGQRGVALVEQPVGISPGGRQVVGRAGVQVRPGDGQLELFHLGLVSASACGADPVQHLHRGQAGDLSGGRCRGGVHASMIDLSTDRIDSVFESVCNFSRPPTPAARSLMATTADPGPEQPHANEPTVTTTVELSNGWLSAGVGEHHRNPAPASTTPLENLQTHRLVGVVSTSSTSGSGCLWADGSRLTAPFDWAQDKRFAPFDKLRASAARPAGSAAAVRRTRGFDKLNQRWGAVACRLAGSRLTAPFDWAQDKRFARCSTSSGVRPPARSPGLD